MALTLILLIGIAIWLAVYLLYPPALSLAVLLFFDHCDVDLLQSYPYIFKDYVSKGCHKNRFIRCHDGYRKGRAICKKD